MSGLRFDFVNKLITRQAIAPQSIAGTTVLGAAIDCNDLAGDVGLYVEAGAVATSVDAKLQESDVSGSGFADCAIPCAIVQITTANKTQMVRGLRTKRYLRVSTTTVGTALVAASVLGFSKAQ